MNYFIDANGLHDTSQRTGHDWHGRKANPFLRMGDSGVRHFATTADLNNGMMFGAEQDIAGQYFQEDNSRRAARNPSVILAKKMILRRAGYTPEESDQLANDETFYRPEFAKYGIKNPRPMTVNMYGSRLTGRQRRFDKAADVLDDSLALEKIASDARLDQKIDQEKRIAAEFPEDGYFGGGSSRSGGTRSASGKPAVDKDRKALIAATNRSAILSGKQPIMMAPADGLDPAAHYVGHNISKGLQDAENDKKSLDYFSTFNEGTLQSLGSKLDALDETIESGKRLVKSGKATSADLIALRNAEAQLPKLTADYNKADREMKDIKIRRKAADENDKLLREQADAAGFETHGSTAYDPNRGRVYNFQKAVAPKPQSYFDRLDPVAKSRIVQEAKSRVQSFDSDNPDYQPSYDQFFPEVVAQYRAGGGYRPNPRFDPNTGVVNRGNMDVSIRAQNRFGDIDRLARVLIRDNPDLDAQSAVSEASRIIRSGRPSGRNLSSIDPYIPGDGAQPMDLDPGWDSQPMDLPYRDSYFE